MNYYDKNRIMKILVGAGFILCALLLSLAVFLIITNYPLEWNFWIALVFSILLIVLGEYLVE